MEQFRAPGRITERRAFKPYVQRLEGDLNCILLSTVLGEIFTFKIQFKSWICWSWFQFYQNQFTTEFAHSHVLYTSKNINK